MHNMTQTEIYQIYFFFVNKSLRIMQSEMGKIEWHYDLLNNVLYIYVHKVNSEIAHVQGWKSLLLDYIEMHF